jgi:hypothetical protein
MFAGGKHLVWGGRRSISLDMMENGGGAGCRVHPISSRFVVVDDPDFEY